MNNYIGMKAKQGQQRQALPDFLLDDARLRNKSEVLV
jgi:hypothetical protein